MKQSLVHKWFSVHELVETEEVGIVNSCAKHKKGLHFPVVCMCVSDTRTAQLLLAVF